jgi:2-polyprenyl-3-methyl-5-hydroxy-6-metoxy-1,4-benzoquinol methylase
MSQLSIETCIELAKTGRYEQAICGFQKVLQEDAQSFEGFRGLAFCYGKTGNWSGAITNIIKTLAHSPNGYQKREIFLLIDIMQSSGLQSYVASLERPLKFSFNDNKLILKVKDLIWRQIEAKHPEVFSKQNVSTRLANFDDSLDCLIKDDYFCILIEKLSITHYFIEDILKLCRRELLLRVSKNVDVSPYLTFLAALACQTLLNDGIYSISDEESHLLNVLKLDGNSIKQADQVLVSSKVEHLILAICYSDFEGVMAIWKNYKNEIQSAGLTYLEAELAFYFEVMSTTHEQTVIDRSGSKLVQSFYMENPYPKWKFKNIGQDIQQMIKNIGGDVNADLHVLIAGCGTGGQVIECALGNPDAKITAIDLSPASLKYAKLMAQRFDLTNIEFKLLDILDVKKLNQVFDYIVCTGVLHHMESPQAGLNALESVLASKGYMRLALYSKTARSGLAAIKKDLLHFLNTDEAGVTRNGVRAWRGQLSAETKNSPYYFGGDFFTLNGLFDLLLHPQQKEYSLIEIKKILESADLAYVAISNPVVGQELADILSKNPVGKDGYSLEYWDKVEESNPLLFVNMVTFFVAKEKNSKRL